MNKTKSQSGFAHLIIIMVLALAIVITVGYVYWQRENLFQAKKDDSGNQANPKDEKPKPAEKAVSLKTVSFDSTKTISATVDYPEDWTIDQISKGGSEWGGSETIKLTSPSKDVFVDMAATNATGIGGTCTPSDEAGTFVSFNSTGVEKFPTNVNFVESIVKSTAGYTFQAQIEKPMDYADADMVGKSSCDHMFVQYIPYKSPVGDDGYFRTEVHIASLTKYYGPQNDLPGFKVVDSRDIIDSAIKANDYIAAKNILLSLR